MTFKEWLDEIEAFSTRGERLSDECHYGVTYDVAFKWVKAAYEVGYKQGQEDGS